MTFLETISSRPMPFAKCLGVTFIEASDQCVKAKMTVREDLCTVGSIAHGGALMALADSVGAAATFISLPKDAKGTATIESQTNFISPAPLGATVIATALPIAKQSQTQVWQTRIELEDGRLVAVVVQTQIIL